MDVVANQVFDGTMLSDASVKCTGVSALFCISQAGVEHIDWLQVIKDSLSKGGIKFSDIYPKTYTKTIKGKPHLDSYLYSSSCPELVEQYFRWYAGGQLHETPPNKRYVGARKVVPADLEITPIVLAHWFMGDGSSSWMKAKHVIASFSTCCFSVDEVEFLIEEMKELNIDAYRGTNGGSPVIQIGKDKSIVQLMGIIEPYLAPSMMYKVKKPK